MGGSIRERVPSVWPPNGNNSIGKVIMQHRHQNAPQMEWGEGLKTKKIRHPSCGPQLARILSANSCSETDIGAHRKWNGGQGERGIPSCGPKMARIRLATILSNATVEGGSHGEIKCFVLPSLAGLVLCNKTCIRDHRFLFVFLLHTSKVYSTVCAGFVTTG